MNNDSLKDDSQLPEQQGSGDRRPGLKTSCDWLAKQLVLTPRDLGSRMALGLALGDLGDHEGGLETNLNWRTEPNQTTSASWLTWR